MSKTHTEEWAEQILSTEEGRKLQEQLEKEFVEYIVFGKAPYYGDEDFFEEFKEECEQTYDLTASEIVEKFDDVLSPEQKEELQKYINNR